RPSWSSKIRRRSPTTRAWYSSRSISKAYQGIHPTSGKVRYC
ncbi:MAG: hypothetical protein AVDCRST_MAG03-3689, partial [uncultured Rubrobacteraceae bacterium]